MAECSLDLLFNIDNEKKNTHRRRSSLIGDNIERLPCGSGRSLSPAGYQSRPVIMIDGGGARANEGQKTFSRGFTEQVVRLTAMGVSHARAKGAPRST